MYKTGSVQTITPGQMKELGSAAQQAVPTDLPFVVADYWEHNKGELIRRFQNVLQSVPGVNPESPVLTKIVSDCQRVLRHMFGRHCPEVGPLPAIVTEEQLGFWAKYNMHPIFLPELDLTEDARLPKRWIRPMAWFYQKLREGKIGEAIPSLPPTKLCPGWYLADFSIGADYTNGTQVFPNDPWAPLMERLRRHKLVGKYDETPMGSRFAVTHDEWVQVVLGFMSAELGFPRVNLRLERVSEFNAIGNLYDLTRGKFNTWEWFADPFGDSSRLVSGDRRIGGLAVVYYAWPAHRFRHIAGRPLVVL